MIDTAVILMAGLGSRLRGAGHQVVKPLTPLLGRPLLSYTLDTLGRAGVKTVYAVVGFEKDAIISQAPSLAPPGLSVRFIENPDYRKQNGISVLAAANFVDGPFLLTMADHMFDQTIVDLVQRAPIPDGASLAVDRKIATIFDLDDAMKVRTRGDRVIAIGKDLTDYDAIDTGVFACSQKIFDYLEAAKRDGDCSLADGVRALAADGKMGAIDIGEAWWQDVDTPEMLAAAAIAMARPDRGDNAENHARAGNRRP